MGRGELNGLYTGKYDRAGKWNIRGSDRKQEGEIILNFVLISHVIKIDFRVSKTNKLDILRSMWNLVETHKAEVQTIKSTRNNLGFIKSLRLLNSSS